MNRTFDVFREWLWFLGCVVATGVGGVVVHVKGTFQYQVAPDSPVASYPTFMLFWVSVLAFLVYGAVNFIRLVLQTVIRSK
jgi:hypothetical protein